MCARWLRQTAGDLRQARSEATIAAAGVATTRERARHARAVHDHVLQTLEILIRVGAVTDPELLTRVTGDVTWLRDFVIWGHDAATGELRALLLGAAARAADAGLEVRIHDAGLGRPGALSGVSPAAQRDLATAVGAVLDALAAFARRVALRVEPETGAVRVVLAVTDPKAPLVTRDLPVPAGSTAGCALTIASDGVIELSTPPHPSERR